MYAEPGDWLVTEARSLSRHARQALILAVRSADGGPPYLVRWADNGHEGLVVPGPDSRVVSASEHAAAEPV